MGFVAPGVWSVGATRVGLGHFGYSAVPIRRPDPPSGTLESSIPCLGTVLRRGVVDANPSVLSIPHGGLPTEPG